MTAGIGSARLEAPRGASMSRKPQDRRTFIKTMAGGAVALGVLAGRVVRHRNRRPRAGRAKNGMAYRRLGRTGLLVSEISLGSSPLPDPDLLRAIIDRGVNYIDTSHNYDNGNAERRDRPAPQGRRAGQGPRRDQVPRRAAGHSGIHRRIRPREPPAPRTSRRSTSS
ncbi:MAG: hypothetical protein MZV64_43920 [Ignavibacteriales bacterium]|nr:hypothetical protein [Ignavibacteriales bacterium]